MLQIQAHYFSKEVQSDFKSKMQLHEMWESTWENPRFKCYWTEDMQFQDGLTVYEATINDVPVGLLVHECARLAEKMYSASLGGNGCKWIKPEPTGDRWLNLGSIGIYVRPEFRNRSIATLLFKQFQDKFKMPNLNEHDFKVYPFMEGSGAAYKLMHANTTRFYAVDSGSKKDTLFKLVKDLKWLEKLDPNSRSLEPGPFYGTRWIDMDNNKDLNISLDSRHTYEQPTIGS